MLVYYDFSKFFILSVDVGLYGIGVVLSYRLEDGFEKFIEYVFRIFSLVERNYV